MFINWYTFSMKAWSSSDWIKNNIQIATILKQGGTEIWKFKKRHARQSNKSKACVANTSKSRFKVPKFDKQKGHFMLKCKQLTEKIQ